MKKTSNHKLQSSININGHQIEIVRADATEWIPIKPTCAALNIDYAMAFDNIKEDDIIRRFLKLQRATGRDGKTYKMLCLPHKYLHSWVFSIKSASKELHQYKLQCANNM